MLGRLVLINAVRRRLLSRLQNDSTEDDIRRAIARPDSDIIFMRTLKKPNLFFADGMWWCSKSGLFILGVGASPSEAYSMLLRVHCASLGMVRL
jgi:hypothetical protein